MRRAIVVTCAALVGWSAIGQDDAKKKEGGAAAGGQAQQGAPAGMPSAEEMQKMMAAMQAAMTPGPEHEYLKKSVGSWNLTIKVFMAGPSGPPAVTKGTSEIKSVMGGKFVHEEMSYEMDMPGMGKMSVQGAGYTGYNNYRKVFEASWCDNMNTHMLKMSGTMPPGTDTITMYGEMDEPALGMVGRTIKGVLRRVSDKQQVFEIYDLAVNEDYKVIEITYDRK